MAARVNHKFVALLVVALVAMVGLSGLAYWKLYYQTAEQLRVDAERHLVEAQRYASEVETLRGEAALMSYRRSGEEYQQATSLFGQAFVKDPTNLEVLENYIYALERMHASTRLKAQEFHGELMRRRKLAVELSGNAPERLETYYRGLMDMAPWAGPTVYENVFREAETRLAVNPTDAISKKYRGIVGVLRLDDSSDLNGQRAVLADLEAAAAQMPEDPDLLLARAGYEMFEAQRVSADPAAFGEAIDAAIRATDAVDAAPKEAGSGRRIQLGQAEARLEITRLLRQVANDRQRQGASAERVEALRLKAATLEDRVTGTVAELEASIASDPSIDDLVRTADLLTATDRSPVNVDTVASTGGLERTEDLVRSAMQADPLNLSYKVMLGNLLRLRQEHDEALKVFREADALEAIGPSEMMLRTDARRRQARFEIASIELIKAEAAEDSEVREALLKGAESAVAELINAEQRTARVLLLEGKIALLRGQTTKAMQALDRAVGIYESTGRPNVEAILLSARARQAERQWGAASERLESLLASYPLGRSPSTEARIRRQLAEIYLSSNRPKDAEQQIQRLQEIGANDRSTTALSARLALGLERVDDAARLFEEAGLLQNSGIVRQLARGYQRVNRASEGLAILRSHLANQPGDIQVLAELLPRISEEEKAELLAAAEQAGADPSVILLLRSGEEPGDRQRIVDSLATRSEVSEFEEQLQRAALWERMQEPEKAAAAYDRARAIEPDSPRLLMEDLRVALAAGDMESANALAERASQENLDLAEGRFIRGQVAAAQGDTGRAIILYREGLGERPVYDQGWKTLGDLLMRENNPADAAEAYAQASRQRPDNVSALIGLASAHRMRGRNGAALSALRSAVEANPENTLVREQYLAFEVQHGDPGRAVDFREAWSKKRPDDVENRIALANLLSDRGQPSAAVAELEAAANQPGAGPAVAAAQANLVSLAEGIDAGAAFLQDRLSTLGASATVEDHLNLGRFLASRGRLGAATAAYREAASLESQTNSGQTASRELGDHLFSMGAADEAAEVYADLLENESLSGEDRKRVVLRQAETLVRAERTEEAEALLADANDSANAFLLRAVIANQRGDDAAARDLIEQALKVDPSSSAAYLQRALLPGAAPADALADATRAAELSPGNSSANRVRVSLLLAEGRNEDAAAILTEGLRLDPSDIQARVQLAELRLREGREGDARELIAAGRRQNPGRPIWDAVSLQIDAASSEDAVAIPALRTALGDAPSASTLARLTRRLLGSGDPDSALEAMDAHPTILQESPELQGLRGRALADSGDKEAAANVLGNAISRSRTLGEFARTLGDAASVLGSETAVALSNSRSPSLDPAGLAIVQSSLLLTDGNAEASLELLRSSATSSLEVGGSLAIQRMKLLANALQSLGRASEAQEQYEELLKFDGEDVSSLNNLAFLLGVSLERPAEAVPLAKRALDAMPAGASPLQRAAVLDTLGWVQQLSGDSAAARESLEESIRSQPIAAAHLHLAHVYRSLNLERLAEDQARRAEEMATQSEDSEVLDGVEDFRSATN